MAQRLSVPADRLRSQPAFSALARTPQPGSMATRQVLVIAADEARGSALVRALALGLLCDVTSRGFGVTAIGHKPPDAVVILVGSLGQDASVRSLQDHVHPFVAASIPLLCLLESPTLHDEVRARAIGATMVLASAAPSRVIAAALRTLVASPTTQRREAQQEAMRAGVRDVGFVLADLMRAASDGLRVDGQLSEQAAQLMLRVLDNDGIGRWMAAVGLIHDQTYRHCLLMSGVMASFVLQLGLPAPDCQRLTSAAILHDIGKALIPAEIIDKAGPLTEDERAIFRGHAAYGHELLVAQGGHHPEILDIVRHHHEYLDGSGYPDRLRAAQIVDPVRIATICDVFAALIERRSYKPSLPVAEAFVLLDEMHGKLDIDLVRAFKLIFGSVPFKG